MRGHGALAAPLAWCSHKENRSCKTTERRLAIFKARDEPDPPSPPSPRFDARGSHDLPRRMNIPR